MSFQPMKGESAIFSKLFNKIKKYYISPKLDGIRAIYVNNTVQSAAGKEFRNIFIQQKFKELSKIPYILDGELFNTTNNTGATEINFSENTKDIMSIKKEIPNLKFFIFDLIDPNNPSESVERRYEKLLSIKSLLPNWCIIIKKEIVESIDDIEKHYINYLDNKFEGAVINGFGLPYKHGRSTVNQQHCLKIKPEEDAEAIVVGWKPLFSNLNEQEEDELGYSKRSSKQEGLIKQELIGSLECKTIGGQYFDEGIEFSVGGGLTDKLRKELWEIRNTDLIGKTITYKFFNHGGKDKPRQPRFKSFREDL